MSKSQAKVLGRKIKEIRKSLGLNQSEFAREIDATVPAVSNWENGRNMPNDARLKAIAEVGGTSVLNLLNNKSDNNDVKINEQAKEKLKRELLELFTLSRSTPDKTADKEKQRENFVRGVDSAIEQYDVMFPQEQILKDVEFLAMVEDVANE